MPPPHANGSAGRRGLEQGECQARRGREGAQRVGGRVKKERRGGGRHAAPPSCDRAQGVRSRRCAPVRAAACAGGTAATHARTPHSLQQPPPGCFFFFFCALRGVRPPFSGSSLFLGPSATPSSAPAFAPCSAFKAFQGLADPPSALAAWRAGPVWAWRPCRSRAHQTSDPPRAENRTCQEKRGGGPLTQLRPHNLSSLPLPSRQGSNPLKMGVPKRVPSLNSQVEAKVRELGGDKAIHR